MSHAGNVAVITGAGSGIGRALALALGGEGATVVASDIDAGAAAAVAETINAAGVGKAEAHGVDVTDAAAVRALVESAASTHGRLDLMFNNAGIAVSGDARDLEVAHWRKVIEVNLMGVVHGADAAYKVMAAQGSGHIVNIASLAGLVPFPSNCPYSATKHAVVGLSMSLRLEGEDLGVRVSAVCPGFVESNIYTASEAVNLPAEELAKSVPFRKVPAEEAARRILRGVDRNRAIIVFPGYARLAWWLYRLNAALSMPAGRQMIRDLRRLRQHGGADG